MSIGTVHSGCTDPIQVTARLVIVLVSRIQKSDTGGNLPRPQSLYARSHHPSLALLACSRVPQSPLSLGKACGGGRGATVRSICFLTGILGRMESVLSARSLLRLSVLLQQLRSSAKGSWLCDWLEDLTSLS